VNVNKTKDVNRSRTVNKEGGKTWEHNPDHRRNVGYRDPSTQKKFEGRSASAARDKQVRDQARGFDGNDRGGRGDVGGRGDAGKRGDVGGRGEPAAAATSVAW
jgi:hypothetical protein